MLTTIHFHKSLQKYTGVEKHSLNVSSYLDLIQSCINLFPKLRKAFKSISNNNSYSEEITIVVDNKILTKDELYFRPHCKNRITFCPVIYGMGGRTGIIIAVVIIIILLVIITIVSFGSAAPLTGPAGASVIAGAGSASLAASGAAAAAAAAATTAAALQVATLALTIALSFAVQALRPKLKPAGQPSPFDAAQRTGNELFEALNTSSGQGHAVQLNYGLIRVPGHFISGYIDVIEHDKNADISVIERFA